MHRPRKRFGQHFLDDKRVLTAIVDALAPTASDTFTVPDLLSSISTPLRLAVVKPGGFYVIDDMLPQPNWPEGHAEKVPFLLDRLAGDARFILCPMASASGVVIALRKAYRLVKAAAEVL